MAWADEDVVPISALQHYTYCPRQCALIHVEATFDENIFTLRGRRLHERADDAGTEWLGELRHERALPLWSDRLGLTGKADVVAFQPDGTPYPVEYKSGARKAKNADDVQLCGQALCLEEMLARHVPKGALYYHTSRRRREVEFTAELRAFTEETVDQVRRMLASQRLPEPVADGRCRHCSLLDACMPFAIRAIEPPASGGNRP